MLSMWVNSLFYYELGAGPPTLAEDETVDELAVKQDCDQDMIVTN